MIKTTALRLLAAFLLALALSACGFHLRDKIALPVGLGPVRVVSTTPYSPLAESIAKSMKYAGVVAAAADAKDVATLQILSERWGDQPISIDQFGRAQEFSLRYAAVFVFRRADGSTLVPQQAVELSRDYVSPPQNVTGTTTEREIIADELRQEMAASILRRIGGVIRGGVDVKQDQGVAP